MGIPHAEKVMFHDQNSSVGSRIGNLCIKTKNEEHHKSIFVTPTILSNHKVMYF